ncbi:hypothetical protein CKAH01_19135, partial [Colletotrichum kahawae]
PELIPKAFVSRWEESLALPWQAGRALNLPDEECIEALERLIADSRNQGFSHRFCFFIDGLDELQETPAFTFRDLSLTLKSWAEARGGNVKFCVSSREYYQFMDEFDCKSRIRLHELTKQDMIAFVQSKVPVGGIDTNHKHKVFFSGLYSLRRRFLRIYTTVIVMKT